MAALQKVNSLNADILKSVHNFTSDATCTIMIALTAAANPPLVTNSVLADLVQIAYTNIGARDITGVSVTLAGAVATVNSADKTITATGPAATFRYAVLYNDDPTSPLKPLIGFYDLGDQTFANAGDSVTLDFTGGFLAG